MFSFKKKSGVNHWRLCKECSRKKYLSNLIGDQFCLHCKKNTANNIHISKSETMSIRDSFKLKKTSPGFKRFAHKIIGGWFRSHRYKDGVELSRSLDKEKDTYDEIVKDYKTGKIIHEKHEKLSKHTGHGSAKQQ